ncbi:NACHT, LRR and PYD domains-containing protein 1-like isoform X3 [Poecilia reticulata]|uniref:NACHT, LRR and PYD domains-containing protein 1-like isoform X3 n=1 Tax=Poecilia reticulata TaxID=8081 RepID=UPI0007EAC1E9|nr:PREDICTED: NACHT, LRR and PYD domains-containing protein 1-like isoform X3 [Poecilia reticulata]
MQYVNVLAQQNLTAAVPFPFHQCIKCLCPSFNICVLFNSCQVSAFLSLAMSLSTEYLLLLDSLAATSTSLDSVDCGSVEDSSSWTKVDPELDGTSPDQDPTYSLQSAAGHFECSVSGLRWVCREKVGFRYRFCSWDGHMERMESRGFRPAGPLLDISVLTGRVMEVQLPHWVCTDDVPELLKNFAVLHVNDCGDVLEKATRVTKTHVGLAEPVFSLLGAVIKYFFNPRISCNTLMYYQPKTSYLKMRVYLIPPDPALKQSVHSRESSKGYEEIVKPRPDKPLKMGCGFSLQATVETARIQPPEITLRHDSQDPNFYEVFIENPGENFNLELLQTHSEKVWFCEIRKDDHPRSGSTEVGESTETDTVATEVGEFSTEAAVLEAKAASSSTEMPRSIKQLLAETLEDLSQKNLDKFVFQLLDRSGEPRVRRCRVEGKSRLDIVDVLVSTFTEDKAVDVTVEILGTIGCNHQAETLVKEKHGG